MNNETEKLQILHNYCVVSGDGSVLENGNYIMEEVVPKDSTSCAQNNSQCEKGYQGSENGFVSANESNGKSEMNEGLLEKRIIEVISSKEHYGCENVYVPQSESNLENNIGNGKTAMNKGLLENRIIEVISSGNVENIFCIDNVKQEYSVTISDGFQEGSDEQYFVPQPLEYQDLNLVLAENGTTLHVCDVCGKGFRKKSNLKRHYRSHTGDNPHACDQCDARFPTMSGLKEHLLSHTGLRPHVCKVCGKAFSRVSNLRRHCRTHSAEKPYQCDKCAIRFVEPNRLREHYLTHVGEKRFSCDVCGKKFLKKFNLKRHSQTHTGDHAHKCKTCSRGFSKRIYLLVHMENHAKDRSKSETEANSAIKTVASNCIVESAGDHGKSSWTDIPVEDVYDASSTQKDKIFSCKQCSRNYIKESSLLNHMRRHSRTLQICEVCGATFAHASRLREHMVSHSGEKPFSCFQCERRFGRNSNLLRHIATHTGERRHPCGLCNHRFSSGNSLKEHLALHSGEVPHSCEVCGRGFRHKSGLRRHLLQHTGERPHKCATCGKRFSRRGRHHCSGERHHLPNSRVEPRLMNIIQNLEARLCEPIKPKEPQSGSKKRKRDKTGMKEGTITDSKNRKTHSETLGSSEEYEELTVEVTTAESSVVDFSPNLRKRSLRKCASKNFSKSCKSTLVQSELKTKNANSLKKKSRRNSGKAIFHYSKEKASTKQTLESDHSKHENFSKQSACDNHNKHRNIQCAEDNAEQVNQTSEQIEIDDVSAYQTQVLGNDLDTIVIIKANL